MLELPRNDVKKKKKSISLRELKQGLCINLEEWDEEGDERKFQEEGIYVYLWLIHVEVWQKTKFYKAIIFQLKNICFFLKKVLKTLLQWMDRERFQQVKRKYKKETNVNFRAKEMQ